MVEQKVAFGRDPGAVPAVSVLESLLALNVGDVAYFDPPLEQPVVDNLYSLLNTVDRGWRIVPGPEQKLGFWASLKRSMNQPVDFGGRAIPQSIAEIMRTR